MIAQSQAMRRAMRASMRPTPSSSASGLGGFGSARPAVSAPGCGRLGSAAPLDGGWVAGFVVEPSVGQ